MDPSTFGLLVLAGIGAGICGTVAGLASLVSYPALLGAGLSPLAANVTNTLGLLLGGVGAMHGSRRELVGQGRRLAGLFVWTGAGGAFGGVLLLVGSSGAFRVVVPWLVAFGAVLLLARDALRRWLERRRARRRVDELRRRPAWSRFVPVLLVGVYGGYFGAGAGVIMLAILSLQSIEPLAVTNAVKNVTGLFSNGVAAVLFAFDAPVHWLAALAVGLGMLLGSWTGPQIVRVVPERPLRYGVAVAGFGLAISLAVGWPS